VRKVIKFSVSFLSLFLSLALGACLTNNVNSSGESQTDNPSSTSVIPPAPAPSVGECGNGIREDGESCDEMDFNGLSCLDFNFNSGNLTCAQNCEINLINCQDSFSPTANRLLMEDFEDSDLLDTLFSTRENPGCGFEVGSGLASTSIVEHLPRQGAHSLRWDQCNDAVDPVTDLTGCNNVFLMAGNLSGRSVGTGIDIHTPISESREVYVQYWTRYDPDNDPTDLFGQEKYAVGDGSGRVVTIHNRGFGSAMQSYHYDSPLPPVFVHDDQWHRIAYLYRYNDSGQTNSVVRAWVDGQLVQDWVGGFEFTGTPSYLRMKYSHGSPGHYPWCTSSPTQMDDYEVWDGMPDFTPCSDGAISSLCWCGGSSRDYGYCYQNFWDPTEMPSCTPTAEICGDNIDNDCDGSADCSDSECAQTSYCVALECDVANITMASRRNFAAFFNGGYLGTHTYGGGEIESAHYQVPLREGNNSFNAVVSGGGPLIVDIEVCGTHYPSNTSWKTSPDKPGRWMDPILDVSDWNAAAFVSDWGPLGAWFYGLPRDWPYPEADWIWTNDIFVEGYNIGYFRTDFTVEP